jgi:hypothetical protein
MRLEQWLKELEVERNRVYPKVLNQDIHLLGRGPQNYLAGSLVVFHGVEVLFRHFLNWYCYIIPDEEDRITSTTQLHSLHLLSFRPLSLDPIISVRSQLPLSTPATINRFFLVLFG